MATNKSLVNYAVQNISYTANIADPTPSSKLRNITETIVNEIDNFDEYGTRVLNNMYIETCESSFLDRIGSQEGIQRIRAHSVYLSKETMFVNVKNNGKATKARTIPTGHSLQASDTVWIVFPEPVSLVDLGPGEEKYVTVEIKTDINGDSIDIPEGSLYALDFEPDISIHINSAIYVPIIEESESEYRSRLIFSRMSSKFGSEAAVKAAVASSSLVTNYYIDYDYSPVKVYLYSDVLSYNRDYESTLETYSVNTVRAQLNQKKSAGTTFDVVLPYSVSFKLNISPRVNNPRDVDPAIYSFSDFLKLMFKFGQELTIDNDFFEVFKKSLAVDLAFLDDYNIEIIQTYMNFDYAAENNSITIHKNEYPFLESITVG